jgi:hypothetical protein
VKSGLFRHRDGTERLWFEPSDIESMMEEELKNAKLYPPLQSPAVDIERFIEQYLVANLDQYGELEEGILGLTEFIPGRSPRLVINRNLTGAIDADATPMGTRGRWRATLAHEASHVIMHSVLFQLGTDQPELFRVSTASNPNRLLRCEKKNVLFRGGGTDWREVQANMAMAALLMPRGLFRKAVVEAKKELQIDPSRSGLDPASIRELTKCLSSKFEVSKQAAGIRLEVLGCVPVGGQLGMESIR